MGIRLSACILLLLPSLCIAQDWDQDRHATPAIVVNGLEVKTSPFSPMLEVFSKAFNPGQDNVSWPLYAYQVSSEVSSEVPSSLGVDFCEEHGQRLAASGAAFVGPVSSGLIQKSPRSRYTGIQTTDSTWFIDACRKLVNERQRFEEVLDNYLEDIEGVGAYLHGGQLDKLSLSQNSDSVVNPDNDNSDKCVRQIGSGTLSTRTRVDGVRSGDTSAGGHEVLWWTDPVENTGHESVELKWSTIAESTESVKKTIAQMAKNLSKGTEMWKFTPRDPGQFGGHFLISFNASSENSSSENSRRDASYTSWNGGDIEWEQMSGDRYYQDGSFDMWYFPPFCGPRTSDSDSWYMVSKYRLGFDRPLGFRARLFPLKPAAMNAALQP